MPSSQLPDSGERRRLVQEKKPETGQAGRAYLEAGRWGEALECLQTAHDEEGLALLAEKALERGDFFYWSLALKSAGLEPSQGDIEKMAENSRKNGLEQFAKQAQELLGNTDNQE